MATKRQVEKLAKKLGATLEVRTLFERLDATVDAPDGMIWSCGDGVHCLVGHQWEDQPVADVWEDLLERMEYGVEPCGDPDCGHTPVGSDFACK